MRTTPLMLATALLAGVAALPIAASAQVAVPGQAPAVLPVSGPVVSLSVTEEVESAPDMATIGTGVQTRAPTARQAMADNAAAMDRLIAAIVKAGIDRKDVQTSGINLNPQYDYRDRPEGQGPKFLGYEASNQLTVRIRRIDAVGDVVDRMVGAGATNLNGPTFGIQDDKPLVARARAKAIETSRERAQFYAQAAGYRTARLLSISETGTVDRPVVVMQRMDMVAAPASPRTKIEPGQLSTSVTLGFQYVLER